MRDVLCICSPKQNKQNIDNNSRRACARTPICVFEAAFIRNVCVCLCVGVWGTIRFDKINNN